MGLRIKQNKIKIKLTEMSMPAHKYTPLWRCKQNEKKKEKRCEPKTSAFLHASRRRSASSHVRIYTSNIFLFMLFYLFTDLFFIDFYFFYFFLFSSSLLFAHHKHTQLFYLFIFFRSFTKCNTLDLTIGCRLHSREIKK